MLENSRWLVPLITGLSLLALGCNTDDGKNDTDGLPPSPPGGCYPDYEGETGGESGGEEPVAFQCQGYGNGWVMLEIATLTDPTFVPGCLSGTPSGDGDGDNPWNCEDVDFEDLDDLLTSDDVEHPGVCCYEMTDPESIESACNLDCGYAACKLAIGKLREVAATQGDKLKGDLSGVADKQEMPEALDLCAGAIQDSPDGWVTLNWYGGDSESGPYHLINVTLHALCDFDPTVYTVGSPPGECTESINTDPFAEQPTEPTIRPGKVNFYGVYGEGTSAVSNVSHTVSNPGCGTPPCDMSVTALDMDVDDVGVGSFTFENITLSLAEDADGTIDGTEVSIPAGNLVFDVQFKLTIGGSYLWGSSYFNFEFESTDVTDAYFDGATGAFEIIRAEFELGDEYAILNTE